MDWHCTLQTIAEYKTAVGQAASDPVLMSAFVAVVQVDELARPIQIEITKPLGQRPTLAEFRIALQNELASLLPVTFPRTFIITT